MKTLLQIKPADTEIASDQKKIDEQMKPFSVKNTSASLLIFHYMSKK